jgi:hypothetical protein
MNRALALASAVALAAPGAARSGEGMWTFNAFPKEKVASAYGFTPTDAWLDHVRLASARLAEGCSASFVSPDGLVMTNHHCAHECVEQLSTARRDHVRAGFLARWAEDEPRCPTVEVNQLLAITDVTARVNEATKGLEGKQFHEAQRAANARIEAECQTSDALRCEVVTLYAGGRYDLYTYRRFQDVRLVFVPEFAAAFFGGDPDNFTFPRWDLDVAFLRVYDGGRPARLEHWFAWSPAGAKDGELTFVSGNPGKTARQLTLAQLEYLRDYEFPDRLVELAELRGLLTEYQHRGREETRHSNKTLFYVENSVKALTGMLAAVHDRELLSRKAREEQEFRARAAKEGLGKEVDAALEATARAQETKRRTRALYRWVEQRRGFDGELFAHARRLVRAVEERAKPNGQRLEEYRDSALPELTHALFSPAPIHAELEILRLSHGLTKLREQLGADHPFVKQVLGSRTPREVATRAVKGTKLSSPAYRRELYAGGKDAVTAAAARDPMIALAAQVDPEARRIRRVHDEEVDAVERKSGEAIARARFALEGASSYPDATFTPRLSYGRVQGLTEDDGRVVPPFTTFAGAYERHTGREPFALPRSWLAARTRVDLSTPLNLATTNDIIGGNSGSPVVNQRAEIVGLVFDGNLQSLAGDFYFDGHVNRAVAVDSRALLEALSRIYGADRLVHELGGARPAAGAGRAGAAAR